MEYLDFHPKSQTFHYDDISSGNHIQSLENSLIDLQISMHVDWDSSNTEGQLDFYFPIFPSFLWGMKVKNDDFG